MKLESAIGVNKVTWTTIQSGTEKTAYLAYSTTNMPSIAYSTRKGFLVSTADDTGTDVTNVGHVFGRLGEGNKSYPGVNNPFNWNLVDKANTPGLMVSFFPNADADAGLDSSAKSITMEGKAYTWTSLSDFNAPNQPAAAESPLGRAVYINATFAAILSLLITLN